MAVKAYVLIECEVGTARAVAEKVTNLSSKAARVLQVDTVTGPYDIIAQLESDDLNKMGSCITETIQPVHGVKRTTTCLSLDLSG